LATASTIAEFFHGPKFPYTESTMRQFGPLLFLSNPHVQTILGSLLQGHARPARGRTRLVALPDGDRIVLHETPPRVQCGPERIALLVHGLGGSHRSPSVERLAHRLSGTGWRVFRMDLRGAGAGVKLARRIYTGACSDDVRAAVASLSDAYPSAAIGVVGISLGGNICLKYAGKPAELDRFIDLQKSVGTPAGRGKSYSALALILAEQKKHAEARAAFRNADAQYKMINDEYMRRWIAEQIAELPKE